ncbi:C69 family dipeptidase [Kushneria aurantia]|uniref:Dipeptidase n=1 Tax=Kushneria aurantia TaxID=504092 RepID=A0ABV6G1B0_9GAMM|nr:C69 family dipeptidase [Kushneria aurantia]
MALTACAALMTAPPALASYAFYVGGELTESGHPMLGGTGEEVSSHWLEIVPARDHAEGDAISVGVTDNASIPGELIEIPQVAHTFRYLTMNYSDFEGFPAPLTNGGVNEHHVAVRDVWATNRDELIAMTPEPQIGVQYSDLARLVMERSKTARAGVELIGELIEQYGYATYGGNTHLIADPNEAWVVWEFAGGQGLWAAERLDNDEVRVLYPGYIEDFPLDYADRADFMGADNLIDFAVEQGWFDPDSGDAFNVFEVYGPQREDARARTGGYKYMTQAQLEEATREMAPVSERDLMTRVRDPRITDDSAGYGQVTTLDGSVDSDLVRIWVAPTGSVAAPFLPWWLGVEEVPMSYGQHRYLTDGASASFLNPDYQQQEASDFAGRRFKQVMYWMCADPGRYLPQVTPLLEGFEQQSMDDMSWLETSAQTLIAQGERAQARELLTHYATGRAEDAMALGATLTDWLEASARLTGQLQTPRNGSVNLQSGSVVTCLENFDPDRPAAAQQ